MATEGQTAIGPNGERAVFTGGRWVVMPAQQPQMPVDPAFQYQGSRAEAEAARAGNQAAASRYDPALAEAELRARELDLREREIKLGETRQEREEQETAQDQKSLRQRLRTGNILDTIRKARALARKGGTGYSSLLSALPKSDARALQAAIAPIQATLAFDRLQEMRDESKTGGALGSVSERELDLLGSAVASLDTGVDASQFLENLDTIERHFINSQMALSGIDPESDRGRAVYRDLGVSPTPGAGQTGGPMQLGIDRQYSTEQDRRFAALAQSAFDQGAGAEELNALNRQYGYPEYDPERLQAAIRYRDTVGRGVQIGAPESGFNDPSILQRGIQRLGSSPIGSYFGQAANALTLGASDELTGILRGDSIGDAFSGRGRFTNEENLKKSLQAEANPTAAFLGNLSGGAIAAGITGGLAGAGRGAATALAPRALAGDAAFGAAFGAGENNDNRLGGAAIGTIAGAGGGALGRGAVNAVGGALRGVQGPGRTLYDEGVTLTPGQIGAAMEQDTGSAVGRFLKGREDRFSGFSGIGDAINRRRDQGITDFNRAAFRQGFGLADEVPPGIAEEGIDYAADTVIPNTYGRALDNQNFTPDQQFTSGLGARIGEARGLPALGRQTEYALQRSIDPFIDPATSNIPGRNLQKMTQELQRRSSRLDRSPDADGPDASAILGRALDDVGGMVERQSPGTLGAFRDANTSYRNMKILEDAVGRAINTGGRFTPAQLGQAARANAKKYGGRYASQDRPFFDLQRAGQDILPQKVPDSGTAGRNAEAGGLVEMAKAAARNLRLPLYSDPALTALNTGAFVRPRSVQRAGDAIRRRRRIGGLFGAPILTYEVVN